jgi:opacity protein-like surface antigen
MKTKIIVLSIMLFLSCFSYSQIIKSIGFKSGVSLSNQKWEHSLMSYGRTFNTFAGYYSVINADFIKKENWELGIDFGFYKSCNKSEDDPYDLNTQEQVGMTDIRIGFLTFSPILKLKTQLKSFTPYLIAGPRIDYFVSRLSNDFVKGMEADINKTQFGFNIGEGILYNFNNFSIFAEYQFFYSFTKLIDKPALLASQFISRDVIKINSHIISLGLKYHFTKN